MKKFRSRRTDQDLRFEEQMRGLIAMAPPGTTREEVMRKLLDAIERHPQAVKPGQEALIMWLRRHTR